MTEEAPSTEERVAQIKEAHKRMKEQEEIENTIREAFYEAEDNISANIFGEGDDQIHDAIVQLKDFPYNLAREVMKLSSLVRLLQLRCLLLEGSSERFNKVMGEGVEVRVEGEEVEPDGNV